MITMFPRSVLVIVLILILILIVNIDINSDIDSARLRKRLFYRVFRPLYYSVGTVPWGMIVSRHGARLAAWLVL